MEDKPKTSIFKKLFGQNSCCCSFQVEENDKEEDKVSDEKNEPSPPHCGSNKTDQNGAFFKNVGNR